MGIKTGNYRFNEIINSLDESQKILVRKLHEQAVFWGYMPKISTIGKKPNDWKGEYVKNKNVLYILRITNDKWSIRCKLFNLSKYNFALEKCNEHCIGTLLTNSKNCENHGGACKGPIEFSIEGKKYSKCRHFFMFKELMDQDIDDIIKLLEYENNFTSAKAV
jgi:hypothetical protein